MEPRRKGVDAFIVLSSWVRDRLKLRRKTIGPRYMVGCCSCRRRYNELTALTSVHYPLQYEMEAFYMTKIIQKKAGPLRSVLRAGMRLAERMYPAEPTVKQTKINDFHLVVWANEHIGRRILTVGSFEPDEMKRFSTLVEPGEVCIDIGANIGTHTINLASAVGPSGKVIAFEPIRKNALLVELNCYLNGLENVTIEGNPLSDTSGKILSPTMPEADSAYAFFSEGDGVGKRSVTLDEYCSAKGINAVHFVKIDVEGAEMRVLRGGANLFSSEGRPRVVVIEVVAEYLGRFGDSVSDLVDFMDSHGYKPKGLRDGALRILAPDQIEAENIYFVGETGASERIA